MQDPSSCKLVRIDNWRPFRKRHSITSSLPHTIELQRRAVRQDRLATEPMLGMEKWRACDGWIGKSQKTTTGNTAPARERLRTCWRLGRTYKPQPLCTHPNFHSPRHLQTILCSISDHQDSPPRTSRYARSHHFEHHIVVSRPSEQPSHLKFRTRCPSQQNAASWSCSKPVRSAHCQ